MAVSLVIELTPEEEERLNTQAEMRGLNPSEFARQLVTTALPTMSPKIRKSAHGKYAGSRITSEDFIRERREETEREERRWTEKYGHRRE